MKNSVCISNLSSALDELSSSSVIDPMGLFISQVEHDIRSPLASLNMLEKHSETLLQEERELIRITTTRISEILDSLLRQISPNPIGSPLLKPRQITFIPTLIEELIREKRMQYQSFPNVKLEVFLGEPQSELVCTVNPTEFQRVISNLLDNAVESLETYGKVQVNVSKKLGQIWIEISDGGKGIPLDILNRLGTLGVTHGKANGHGLGFHQVRSVVESWGGILEVHSEVGKGTQVRIRI